MGSFLHDLRYSFRSLVRRPEVTCIALLTLGLGIGASTSIFSVVNRVLIRPLPFDHPERIVTVSEPTDDTLIASTSPANYLDWRAQAGSFEFLAGYRGHNYILVSPEGPRNV